MPRDTIGQMAYISPMENGGRTDRAARNQVHKSPRKEQILSYVGFCPQKQRKAYRATTATTPLQIGPNAPESHVALIADNPFLSRNNLKIKRLRFGIIGDARSPIIADPIRYTLRNNCNNLNPPILQIGALRNLWFCTSIADNPPLGGPTLRARSQTILRKPSPMASIVDGPNAPDALIASIADNPFPFHNSFKIKRLHFGIIGDARSPIIAEPIHRNLRNNCNNPRGALPFHKGVDPPLLLQPIPLCPTIWPGRS